MENRIDSDGPDSTKDEAFIDSHPLSAGSGAAAGFTAGALIGTSVGPLGTTVGAVIGTVVGALAGDAIAERIDTASEEAFWREHHHAQSYACAGDAFADFAPAYRVGYTGFRRGLSFQDREAELRMEYEGGPQAIVTEAERDAPRPAVVAADASPGRGTMQYNMSTHPLKWDGAREAARAAYERVAQRQTLASGQEFPNSPLI